VFCLQLDNYKQISLPEITFNYTAFGSMSLEKIILEYSGALNFETINSLLDNLKALQEFRELKRGIQKRLYSVFVECMENMYKYAASDPDATNYRKPFISLGKLGNLFIISTGNIIANEETSGLRSRLEKINGQDHEGLKAAYAAIIEQDTASVKGGAGLGLITIALHSQTRINYSFTSIDQQRSYFEMKILIET